MIMLHAIVEALNRRKHRLLLMAEASMAEPQFKAFRKLLLLELGKDGLEQDLARIMSGQERERNR
jgi:hypothetical protein